MTNRKYHKTNKEYGITAEVFLLDSNKYSVTLKDDDSGNKLPVARIFPGDLYEGAVNYANSLAGSGGKFSVSV